MMRKNDYVEVEAKLLRTFQILARYFVATAIMIALFVLIGWQFNIDFLKHPFPGLAPMSPVSIFCFLLSGGSFFIFDLKKNNRAAQRVGFILVSIPALIGITRIFEAFDVIHLPIDLIFYRNQLVNYDSGNAFGPMALNTAFCFTLISMSLIGLQLKSRVSQALSNYVAFVVFLITLFSLIGYFYKADELYDFVSSYPMAISTAFALMLLSLAYILYNPSHSYFSILTRANTAGTIVRILIPAAILIPVLLGYARLLIHWQSLIKVESGVAALVLSIVLTFVLFVLYITHVINKQEILQLNAEKKFQGILESAPDAMVIVDESGIIKIINAQTERLFGYLRGELLEKKVELLIPQRFVANHPKLRKAYMDNSTTRNMGLGLELYGMRKDGSEFPIEISLSPLQTEEGLLVSAAIRDITQRKKIEDDNRFLASIAINIQDPIITTDVASNITRWNTAAEKLLEWKSEEVVGKNVMQVLNILYPNQPLDKMRASFLENEFLISEVIYHTKSGQQVNVATTTSKLTNAEGKSIGTLILIRDITQRIKAEEKLKQFEHFFNNSNDFSCIANTEGYFEITNPSFNKVLGYSQNELSTTPFLDFVHPDDVTATLQAYDQLKDGRKLIHFINRYRKKEGTYLWFDWNATPDAITGKLYCIARDFTDRKLAEDALKKLNEGLELEVKKRIKEIEKNEIRFQTLVENNHDVITLLDESFHIVYRSPSAERITGWTSDEFIRVPLTDNIHPDDLEYAKGIVRELMNSPGKPINTLFRSLHRDGHYLWVEGTVINLLNDEFVKAIVFNYRDITKRKELEDLLHKANTLARIGGWEVDLVNNTIYWTDITKEIHEAEKDFVPNLAAGINFYKEGETRSIITQKVNEAIQSGTPWDLELQIVTAKNNERWIRTIGETEFVNGKCVRIYGSFQDINNRKNAEINLELRNKELQKANSELDRFVYSVSHDLRAPLKSLLGLITIMDKSIQAEDGGMREKLLMMNRSVLKLDDFIEDILHYARNARMDVAREDIRFDDMIQEIRGSLKFVEGAKDLKLNVDIDQTGKFISDKRRVNVVLNNLISNAIKYQDVSKESSFLTIKVHSDQNQARIEIEDNGIGIEEKNQKRIFEMFYRASTLSTGSGLGLYIVNEVIEKLGGNLTLDSEIKKGTKVFVTIPNLIDKVN